MPDANDSAMVLPSENGNMVKPRAEILRTSGFLGRHPLIGLAMLLLGVAVFAVIAHDLQTHGPLIQNDVVFNNNMHAFALQSSPYLRGLMIFGFYLGEHVIVGIGALLDLYFIYKRYWRELCMVLTAWSGEGVLWYSLSGYFDRPRPVFDLPVWHHLSAPGFPSGHSISVVMCFGLLAYLLAPKIKSHIWKAVIIGLALLIILFVGFSRIFVGDHYLSDVLAGYAIGIAWSGLAYSLIEFIFRKRIHRNVQKE